MSGYFDSIAFTESLLAAMAGKPLDAAKLSQVKSELVDPVALPLDKNLQHGIWNTIVPDGLQLLIAQREKHNLEQRKKQESEQPPQPQLQRQQSDNSGFVYVDVSGSSSPASTQSSTSSSLSQPPPSNLSSSSFSSFDSPTEKALKEALNMTMSRAPRSYRWASSEEKESHKYKAKRERNNEAVRRSREKNKFKKIMEEEKYDQLRKRYDRLREAMKHCSCGCAAQIEQMDVEVEVDQEAQN